MTTREKLEKVLEFIINEENEKASDLLHDVFVEKARGIYEEIATEDEEIEEATEEEVEEAKSDDDKEDKEQVDEADIQDQFADEVEVDSEMIDQEEVAEEDPMGDEIPMDDEMGDAEGEDPVEDAFMNVEDALDELKAEFAQLMGDEEPADMDDEAPVDDMSDMVDAEEEDPLMMGGNDEEPVEEELDYEQVGEGAVNVPDPNMSETGFAAAGGSTGAVGNKSPVASKNDMGGTAVKVNDGSEGDHGDNAVKEDNAGNVNVPGGKAGKAQSNVADPKNSEEASNKKSPIDGS
tara:strand:+ start:3723 stop:4598 length:876 start_codon:yes stop_codon:yes gene_type:complete